MPATSAGERAWSRVLAKKILVGEVVWDRAPSRSHDGSVLQVPCGTLPSEDHKPATFTCHCCEEMQLGC